MHTHMQEKISISLTPMTGNITDTGISLCAIKYGDCYEWLHRLNAIFRLLLAIRLYSTMVSQPMSYQPIIKLSPFKMAKYMTEMI